MMPTTFLVNTTADSGAGSLRQAILGSNAAPGSNTIDFGIGSGAQTISLLSALPNITVPVADRRHESAGIRGQSARSISTERVPAPVRAA